jgi:hypothetical protein
MSHESDLIKSVTIFGMLFGYDHLQIGRNMLFCLKRYNVNFADLLSGHISAVFTAKLVRDSVSKERRSNARLLRESIQIRDNNLQLSRAVLHLNSIELEDLITFFRQYSRCASRL